MREAPGGSTLQATRRIPRLMIAATAGMVVASVALTVFAGPLFDISSRAGSDFEGPGEYLRIVFPEAGNG